MRSEQKTPTPRWGLAGGLLLGLLGPILLTGGCRPGEGDRCFCEGECRGGLVCAAAGATLRPGQCVTDITDNVEDGKCIEGGADPGGEGGADPPPFWDLKYDLPKTDFAPPGGGTDPTTAGSTSEGTSSTSGGTSTSSTGTTGTGSTGGTGTGSTGSTGTTGG